MKKLKRQGEKPWVMGRIEKGHGASAVRVIHFMQQMRETELQPPEQLS